MIFLSYAHDDIAVARRLHADLVSLGYDVWFDEISLLPGHVWELEIRRAIQACTYFLALVSSKSVTKRGYVQRELREAFDVYSQLPEGAAYLVPIRLDASEMPFDALRAIQRVDIFPNYEVGLSKLLRLLEPDLPASLGTLLLQRTAERVNPVDGSILVFVPAGRYVVGSDNLSPRLRPECRDWSSPAHVVTLSAYWVAKYPTTNAQYRRFLTANPGYAEPTYWETPDFNGPQKPVVGVSWFDARAYCGWAGLLLPTEAQWEAAARGSDLRTFPWGNDPATPARANFGTHVGRTTDIDKYPASAGPFGAIDQAGNVWEWCMDAWTPDAYKLRAPHRDPVVETSDSSGRVIRGGSAVYDAEYLAAAVRERFKADHNSRFIGFRCAGLDKGTLNARERDSA